MRTKTVHNVITGETIEVPYTPEEEAAADAAHEAWWQEQVALANAVPQAVSPYQARVALLQAGLLEQVESLMANPATPAEARIAWEYATTIRRESAFINTLGPALGLSDAQIDALFVAAYRIT